MAQNNTRHKSTVAILLIDVVNDFDFPDGDALLKNALPTAARLAKLKERCWKAGIPSMEVYEDHDLGTDGDWVLWASVNNRDQEWTRLLNGNSVGEGTYSFGGSSTRVLSPNFRIHATFALPVTR